MLGQICILRFHCIYCCKFASKISFLLLQQILQVGAASCSGPQSQHTLCHFHLMSPDPLSSFHWNSTLKSFQHPSRVLTAWLTAATRVPAPSLGAAVQRFTHTAFPHGIHMGKVHMFCITQGQIFLVGWKQSIRMHRLSTADRLIPRSCVRCSVSAGRDRRGPAWQTGTSGNCTQAVTLSQPRVALIFVWPRLPIGALCSSPRKHIANHVCCDVFSICFSNLFDTETFPRQDWSWFHLSQCCYEVTGSINTNLIPHMSAMWTSAGTFVFRLQESSIDVKRNTSFFQFTPKHLVTVRKEPFPRKELLTSTRDFTPIRCSKDFPPLFHSDLKKGPSMGRTMQIQGDRWWHMSSGNKVLVLRVLGNVSGKVVLRRYQR